eukprot:TRINITY_DN177_c1_g1_i1.p1 TRINITY_DN177_c1_g1~~TRINITY_DN177_c1_g1_i1.p1  ORF type:complete len:245 (+),score=49.29 TRINITY_DN177_c1_g1_i1:290-1024(+)
MKNFSFIVFAFIFLFISFVNSSDFRYDDNDDNTKDSINDLYYSLPILFELKLNNDDVSVNIRYGDITEIHNNGAIVNPANQYLQHNGGCAKVIAKKAGIELNVESRNIINENGYLKTGSAVETTSGLLKHHDIEIVIHAVGPIYVDGESNEEILLAKAITNSLDIAAERQLPAIAFPAISSGIFGYPIEESSKVIVSTIVEYITKKFHFKENTNTMSLKNIDIVLFDESFVKYFKSQLMRYSYK